MFPSTSQKSFGVKMLPEEVQEILKLMAKHGIIRITYDVCSPNADAEVWTVTSCKPIDRSVVTHIPTKEEREFYASEYDKCFGTAPRSDE